MMKTKNTLHALDTLPDPPKFFSRQARKIYYSAGNEMVRQGILTTENFNHFVNYIYYTGLTIDLISLILIQGYYTESAGKIVPNRNIKTFEYLNEIKRQFVNKLKIKMVKYEIT